MLSICVLVSASSVEGFVMDIHESNIENLARTLYVSFAASEKPSATGMQVSVAWKDVDPDDQSRWRMVASAATHTLFGVMDHYLRESETTWDVIIDGQPTTRKLVDLNTEKKEDES